MKQTLVREVMTTPVVTAGETMPLRHLMGLLYSSGIGAVPVTDPEHRVLGVVSNADLIMKPGRVLTAPAGPPPAWSRSSSRRSRRAAFPARADSA